VAVGENMPKCTFCDEALRPGRGKMFVRTTGQILYFCSSKCERNWKLGRDGKKVKWTKKARKLRES